jgi:hypothetical protein
MKDRFFMTVFFVLLMSALFSGNVFAQISLTNLNTATVENFDGMGVSGTAYLTGWTALRIAGSGTIGQTLTMAVTDGNASSGNIYNVGTTSATDRAFGSIASASTTPAFGAQFINNTGSTVTSIDFAGICEQWRSGASNTANEIDTFAISFDATALNNGTWTNISGMDLTEILTTTTAAVPVNGNADANRVFKSATATGLNWTAGSTMWIRWRDLDNANSDGLLAIDSFSITPIGVSSSSASDIVSANNEVSNIAYANFQNTSIATTADGVRLWSFTIRDGGGSADGDALGTNVSAITITKGTNNGVTNWANTLRRAALYNGSTLLSDISVIGETIAFTGLTGVTTADDGNLTLDVYVTFESAVTDNQQFEFQISNSSVTTSGSTSSFTTFTAASSVTGDANRIEVTAAKIAFTTQPSASVGVNTDFSAVITAQDNNDNTDLDYVSDVTVSKLEGSGNISSASGLTKAATNGVASWNDLRWNTVENNVGIQAASGAFSNVASNYFNVIATFSSNSDIISIANSEATAVSSLMNDAGPLSSSTGVQVWQINLRDGGGYDDFDSIPTTLAGVTFTPGLDNSVTNWSNAINAADLFNGSTHLASATVNATSLVFTGLNVSAADNDSVTLSLRISLKNPLGSGANDNFSFQFEVLNSNVTAGDPSTSSQFAAFTAFTSLTDQNFIDVIATKLAFTTQPPASAYLNTAFSVGVTSEDANGNKDLDYADEVTLASTGAGTLSSVAGLAKFTAAGVVSWNDLKYNTPESMQLTANALNVSNATSSAILIIDPTVRWDGGAGTANWKDAANWNPDGLPTLSNPVILDNTHVSGSYEVYLGASDTARCQSLKVGYAGNTNTIRFNLQSNNSVALKLGDNTAGNVDFAIQAGGVYINGTQVASGSTYFTRAGSVDSVRVYSGGRFVNTTERSFSTPFGSAFTSFESGSTFELNIRGTATATPSLGGRTYGNFIVAADSAGGARTYNSNTVTGTFGFTVQNTLTVKSGVTMGSWGFTTSTPVSIGAMDISSAFSFGTSTTPLTIGGNIISNAAITMASGQSVTLSKAGTITVSGSSAMAFVNGFTVASGTTVELQQNITSGNNVTVDGTLSLTSGTLTTGAFTVNLGASGMLSESGNNTVIGNASATRSISSSNNFGGIGVTINPASDMGSTTVTRVTGTAQSGNGNQSVKRYFDITPTNNSNLNASLTFQYAESELNGNTESGLQFFKSTNSGTNWILMNGTADENNNQVTLSGINSFSRWTVASGSLQPAGFSVNKSLIDFGSVNVNSTKIDSVSVSNNGGDVLTVNGSGLGSFSVAPVGNQSIAIGASMTFYITFAPTSIGSVSNDVEFTHNATGSPTTVTVSGVGTAALLRLDTSNYDFGNVLVGTLVTDTVLATNDGNATMLVTASTSAPFSVSPSGEQSIAASASMEFYVTYSPTAMGAQGDDVTFTHNGLNSPNTVAYDGTGIAPVFSSDASELDFGNVLLGNLKVLGPIVSNTGTAPLNIVVDIISNGDYSVVPMFVTLPVGARLSFTVKFTPSTVGAIPCTIIFTHDASSSPDTIVATGNGVQPEFAVSPSSIAFGSVLLGVAKTDSIIVTNDGTSDLTVEATADEPYSVTPSGVQTVAASSSMKFYVTFTPTSNSLAFGEVTLTHNAGGSPASVTVTGTGVSPVFGAAPSSIDFDNVFLGNLKVLGTIISNTGTAPLNIVVDTIIANGDYSVVPMFASIAAGGQLALTVKFIPTTVGAIPGTIILTHDASSSPDTIVLNGTGVDAVKFRTFKATAELGTPKAVKLSLLKTNVLKAQPTLASAVEAVFAKIGKNGMTFLGYEQSDKTLAKQYAWISYKKGSDLAKLFTSAHTIATKYYPLDSVRIAEKKSKKINKAIKADRKSYDNAAWEQGVLFRLNLVASLDSVTTPNWGALVLDTAATLIGRDLNGMTLSAIGNYVDSVMTYWDTLNVDATEDYESIGTFTNNILRRLNEGFASSTFDTSVWTIAEDSAKIKAKNSYAMHLKGYKSAGEVGIVKRIPGKVDETAVRLSNSFVPEQFSLMQNYPNPFNPTTIIAFDLNQDAFVTLKVYNVLGQEVTSLVNNQFIEAGEQTVEFNASILSSGVYFYRISGVTVTGEQFSSMRKMVLMK